MKTNTAIFDDTWFSDAHKNSKNGSWARAVIDTFEPSGKIYLQTIRRWFESYPHVGKEKKELKKRLESYNDADHLGGANELSWFEFMKYFNWQVKPVSATVRHPDFYISHPFEIFCEVSTLNMSEVDKSNVGGRIDHSRASSRILRKAVDEKLDQLKYAEQKKKPAILVVFDYSSWSGYGTQRFKAIAAHLLKCSNLPSELSALLYIDKGVNGEGKIVIYGEKSAAYHNPCAKYPVPSNLFEIFPQFFLELKEALLTHELHSTWVLG